MRGRRRVEAGTARGEDEFLDDVTQIYLNEIGATRLLTAQEELGLARGGMMLIDAGKQQLHFRYARDAAIDNGYRLGNEFALRYSAFFD